MEPEKEILETQEVEKTPEVQPEVEKEPKKTTKKAKKETETTVEGVRITVVGEAVHSSEGIKQYRVTVDVPRRENFGLYTKESILTELKKTDLLFNGIITHNIDSVERIDVPVTFIGKNVFDLTRNECAFAKAYYGLGGFKCYDGDLRTVQREIYRRFARFFHINNGTIKEYLKWQPIVLKKMITPYGDTVLPEKDPVAFDDLGDCFRKTFRAEEK